MTSEPIVKAAVEAFEAEVKKYPRAHPIVPSGSTYSWGIAVDDAMRVVLEAVGPLVEQRLLDRLARIYEEDGSEESRRIAMALYYWYYCLPELAKREIDGPPSGYYAQAVIEQVTPRIEADLLERVAAIYEQENGDGYAMYTGGGIVERLRYWRDNLTELAKMRGGSEASDG